MNYSSHLVHEEMMRFLGLVCARTRLTLPGPPDVELFRPASRRCLRQLPVPAPTKDGDRAMDHSILAGFLLDKRLFKCH